MPDPLLQGMYRNLKRKISDAGSRAHASITVAEPEDVPDGWYWYGQRANVGEIAAKDVHGRYLLIRQHPDSFDASPLARPDGYSYKWGMKNAGGAFMAQRQLELAMYRVNAPGGFVAISDIFNAHIHPEPKNFACLSMDCVVASSFNGTLWDDHGSGAQDDGSMWWIPDDDPNWRLFRAQSGYGQPEGVGYRLNMDLVEIVGG